MITFFSSSSDLGNCGRDLNSYIKHWHKKGQTKILSRKIIKIFVQSKNNLFSHLEKNKTGIGAIRKECSPARVIYGYEIFKPGAKESIRKTLGTKRILYH